jgi:hypothetical protein
MAFAGFTVVTARHEVLRYVEAALFVWCASRIYGYWADPMPPRYAARVAKLRETKKNEPRFGTKLWHKFAIGLIAVLGDPFRRPDHRRHDQRIAARTRRRARRECRIAPCFIGTIRVSSN